MLIRRAQMMVFEQAAVAQFTDFMVNYIRDFYRYRFDEMGESLIREKIKDGIERAEQYDITERRDVCLYIDLMFNLGFDFDCDPALPWAHRVLNDPILTPTQKVRQLFDAVP